MIKNEKQYKITKRKLLDIGEKMSAVDEDRLIFVSLATMKQQLEREIAEYELLKGAGGPAMTRPLSRLPSLIIEYKIRSGLTQKEFAQRIGMKEQQLQRYEAEDFQSISFRNLLKIMDAIGLNLSVSETARDKK